MSETAIWKTCQVELFGQRRSVATKPVGDLFKESALGRRAACAEFAHAAQESLATMQAMQCATSAHCTYLDMPHEVLSV